MASLSPSKTGKQEQPRFRGTWNPVIADPEVTHFTNFNAPETKKAAKALEVLLARDEETEDVELDAVVVGKAKPSSSSSSSSSTTTTTLKLPNEDDEDYEVLLESKKRVERLRNKPSNKDLDLDALAETLIRTKAKQAAMVGLASGAPSVFLPGFGLFVGAGVDVALTSKLQFDLIMEMMWLYGREDLILADKAKRRELVLVVMGVGGIEPNHPEDPNETEKAGERIAKRSAEEVGKRGLIYAIPLIGSTAAAASNVAGTYTCGKRAQARAKNALDDKESWSSSVKKYVVPQESQELSKILYEQVSQSRSMEVVKSAFTEAARQLGESGRRLISRLSSSTST